MAVLKSKKQYRNKLSCTGVNCPLQLACYSFAVSPREAEERVRPAVTITNGKAECINYRVFPR